MTRSYRTHATYLDRLVGFVFPECTFRFCHDSDGSWFHEPSRRKLWTTELMRYMNVLTYILYIGSDFESSGHFHKSSSLLIDP